MPPLTPREKQVHELVEQGRTIAEIAHQLGIAPGTVKIHKKNVAIKLRQHAEDSRPIGIQDGTVPCNVVDVHRGPSVLAYQHDGEHQFSLDPLKNTDEDLAVS